MLTDRRVVITGGTGSVGQVLVRRLLTGELGIPAEIVVFSRDEGKQYAMRLALEHRRAATDDVVYGNRSRVKFRIGNVSDFASVRTVLRDADVVFHAAALKQVPTCEYMPFEAVKTNVVGTEALVRAIRDHGYPVDTVIGISTDKACKPVNVMGMTKALQERILVQANIDCPDTRFVAARYGNVLASRGSVIPLFHEQIRAGGPVTVTSSDMTRFWMSLDDAVDAIFAAYLYAHRGEIVIPCVPSARVIDVARALIADRPIEILEVGTRPGEKTHEILISEEEAPRTVRRGKYLLIQPALPELQQTLDDVPFDDREFSSERNVLPADEVAGLLQRHHLWYEDATLNGSSVTMSAPVSS